jgi:hypothetical protein
MEEAAQEELVTFRLEDGTIVCFRPEEIFPECFRHETARWRKRYYGEDPGPAHPFVEAMRRAPDSELQRLASEEGTMIFHFLGEDAVMRGEIERSGPPVREVSPGRYE